MRYDIVVVGGGPAGLSAAVQARTRGKTVLILSSPMEDIPLVRAEQVNNYLGLPHCSGQELLDRFTQHAISMGAVQKTGRVLNILPMGDTCYLSVGNNMEEAGSVILATGLARTTKYRGEAAFLGRGVSYCATCDGMLYRGKQVAVVGKSADAPAEANYLLELGCRVTYVSSSPPNGLNPAIPFVRASQLEIIGQNCVTALRAGPCNIPCSCVFLLQSSVALADLLPSLALENGYIAVDRTMATNLPGIFAAGDCTGPPFQISKAVGEGLVAGQQAAEYQKKERK